jgi:23S rRNA pseudouridine1911/1915/1917 synthase
VKPVTPPANAISPAEPRETLRLIVPDRERPKRIDSYLAHQVENATRTKVQAAIEAGMVVVNGKTIKPSYRLAPGDVIDITFPRPPRPEAKPEDIPLEIVYEDGDLIVLNKASGMVAHPAYGNYSGTLVNALLHHCDELSHVREQIRPGIVHRLDKDTTGLMVVAKNDVTHVHLSKQFAKRTTEREYWAIVWGTFQQQNGVIDASLARSKRDRKKVAVAKDGKHAVTEYTVLQEFDFLSLVRLKLRTGRTHQIRVHLAHIGHPVFGDPTYGGRNQNWNGLDKKKSQQAANLLEIIHRQALHAKTIGFVHPSTSEMIRFDSVVPEDMEAVLNRLGGVSKAVVRKSKSAAPVTRIV